MLRRYWRFEIGAFVVVWLGLLAAGRSRFFEDPGTFWHVVVGDRILSQGRFDDFDTFSYTRTGEPWAIYEWLGECAMAVVHRISGFDGLLLGSATLLAALFAWLARRLSRAGLHWSWACLVVALTLAASASHFHARPHLITILFLALTVDWLARCDAGTLSLGRLFWLVPTFVVWSNAHGGVLGGIGTVAITVIGWCTARLVGLPTPLKDRKSIVAAVTLAAACGLAAFVNPFGTRVPQTWMWIMRSRVLPAAIKEHAPLGWATPESVLVALLAGVYLFVLLGTLPARPRVTWLLPVVWAVLACERVRHAPLFAVTAAVAIAEMFPHCRWRARFASESSSPGGVGWWPVLVPAGLVGAALCLQICRAPAPLIGSGWARLNPAHWPLDLVPDLRRFEHAEDGGTRIFNEYALGAFLIYNTPGYRVFIDDRCEVYGDALLGEYVHAEREDADALMAQWHKRYEFELALTWRGSRFDRWCAAQGWAIEAETTSARFYRRATLEERRATALPGEGRLADGTEGCIRRAERRASEAVKLGVLGAQVGNQ